MNEWLTYVYNLVEACNYGDSTNRIIRDVLIIGCESDRAKDKIIQAGETITLNETIEILQTEASTNSTLRQFQEIQKKPTASVYYQSYDSRSKKSKLLLMSRIPVLLLQVPRRNAFDVVNPSADNT